MLKNNLYFFNPNNLFKKGRHLTFIEKKINNLQTKFNNFFPNLHLILNNNYEKFEHIHQISSFLIGILYGIGIYYFTIYQIEGLPVVISSIMLHLTVALTTVSMTFNRQVRCLMTLSTFNFLTSVLKIILTSFIISQLLHGPIENTFENAINLAETIKCHYELNKNFSTKAKQSNSKRENNATDALISSQSEMLQINNDFSELIEATDDLTSADESFFKLSTIYFIKRLTVKPCY
jgi:hypothetical protein